LRHTKTQIEKEKQFEMRKRKKRKMISLTRKAAVKEKGMKKRRMVIVMKMSIMWKEN
jgi:hypothetical protein